jgi:hypothetical protein
VTTRVDRRILVTAGEQKVLEVTKHWAASVWPSIMICIGLTLMILALIAGSFGYWPLMIAGVMFGTRGTWRVLEEYRDRFVITNRRVFRISGVASSTREAAGLQKLTDISTKQSAMGKLLGYGHFIFETAGRSSKGLGEIRYVADIDKREDLLRTVINGDMPVPGGLDEEEDGT